LAERLGINPKTIRYWEEKAKSAGFKLDEIKEIISLKLSGIKPCECVEERIKKKIEEIDKLIEELISKKRLLKNLLNERRKATASVCPIIESIEQPRIKLESSYINLKQAKTS